VFADAACTRRAFRATHRIGESITVPRTMTLVDDGGISSCPPPEPVAYVVGDKVSENSYYSLRGTCTLATDDDPGMVSEYYTLDQAVSSDSFAPATARRD
jgi:hypothetical protein